MKPLIYLASVLTLLTCWQAVAISIGEFSSAHPANLSEPTVKKARLKGRKLIVIGDNFDPGAVILINGQIVKTKKDSASPTTRLIAKKAGKIIEPDKLFGVAVQNSDGEESDSITYFKGSSLIGRVLPTGRTHQVVYLEVGEYALTYNLDSATRIIAAPNVLTRVLNAPLPFNDYWLYQAVEQGESRLYAEQYNGGEAPPFLLYDVGIIVE